VSEEKTRFWFDSFEASTGIHGAKLSFNLSNYKPRDSSRELVAEGYTSLECMKSMAFMLVRQIKSMEREIGVSYPIPNKVLNEWNVGPEDWEDFWK